MSTLFTSGTLIVSNEHNSTGTKRQNAMFDMAAAGFYLWHLEHGDFWEQRCSQTTARPSRYHADHAVGVAVSAWRLAPSSI